MTSTIVTGVLNGTGGNNTTVLYNNDTGGNVRIIWYYMYVGYKNGASQSMFIGGDPPADGDLYSNQQSGTFMNVVRLETPQQLYAGTNLAVITGNDHIHNNASTANNARFPLEVMLANGHKLSFWTDSVWVGNETALHYNFIAIPE